jgi:hypothetical protein
MSGVSIRISPRGTAVKMVFMGDSRRLRLCAASSSTWSEEPVPVELASTDNVVTTSKEARPSSRVSSLPSAASASSGVS